MNVIGCSVNRSIQTRRRRIMAWAMTTCCWRWPVGQLVLSVLQESVQTGCRDWSLLVRHSNHTSASRLLSLLCPSASVWLTAAASRYSLTKVAQSVMLMQQMGQLAQLTILTCSVWSAQSSKCIWLNIQILQIFKIHEFYKFYNALAFLKIYSLWWVIIWNGITSSTCKPTDQIKTRREQHYCIVQYCSLLTNCSAITNVNSKVSKLAAELCSVASSCVISKSWGY